ncbi:MAG: type IV pilus assembly protein PilM [Acidobacteria bacterium]|nr:type IV pilus assembly protein PilM [Acidobacteriota bacterium]MBI3654891.1 type IV pilus assembly protein PilM [Acidobacteriota bacterium]
MVFGGKHVVGLDIGSSAVKAIQLSSQRGNNYRVVGLGVEPLPQETIVDGAIISKLPVADAINKIYTENQITNKKVATAISGNSVIVKKISVRASGDEDITEALRYEAEQYIPFDVADVNIDYQILSSAPDADTLNVLLVAAKKEKIADHTSVVVLSGKIPSIVDLDVFALQNAYEVNYEPDAEKCVALLNVGASSTNINIVKGQDSLFARDVPMGGNQFTELLQKEFSVSYEEAEKIKRGEKINGPNEQALPGVIRSVSELIALEIEKTLDFFKTTSTHNKIDQILVSGGSARIPGLIAFLSEKFETPTELFDPFKRVTYDTNKFTADYMQEIGPSVAVALGLALRTTEDA